VAKMKSAIGQSGKLLCRLPEVREVLWGDVYGNLTRGESGIGGGHFLKQQPCCLIKVWGVFLCPVKNLLSRRSIGQIANILKDPLVALCN
jgi:hypothetical protein